MQTTSDLQQVIEKEASHLLPTYDRLPILLERGEGVYLFDSEGNRYLDFLSGIGVNALGYAHPAINKTLVEQAPKLVHISNLFFHKYQGELAELLTGLSGLDRAFFCNSGTEAWEGALKLARAYARYVIANGAEPKTRFLVMDNSFHGRSFGALSTTGQAKYQAPFAPLVPGCLFVRFNDVEDLKAKFDDTICAIGLETVQGEGGIRPVSPEFLAAARELTQKSGALLMLDEIQCGLGRTGQYFAYQHYGITPDIVTVAKPLASGLPLGAILTTNEVSASFHPGMHGTTFGGGPLACAVALEFLKTLGRERLVDHAAALGDYFATQLLALKSKHSAIVDVRALGLMVGVELNSAELAKSAVKIMLERGIIINRTNETVLRFLPPYIVKQEHVDEVLAQLDEILSSN
ncbi:MAG TPA: aspartate aminotransferase family protein [Terriglobales bacterium]|nr:aspartate aminotransferase family protein [Terriglobales bacterium]